MVKISRAESWLSTKPDLCLKDLPEEVSVVAPVAVDEADSVVAEAAMAAVSVAAEETSINLYL